MDGFQVVCKLCDLAAVNVSEMLGDKCVEPVNVYGQKVSRERRENQNACDAAGHVEDEFLRKSTELLLISSLSFLGCWYSAS